MPERMGFKFDIGQIVKIVWIDDDDDWIGQLVTIRRRKSVSFARIIMIDETNFDDHVENWYDVERLNNDGVLVSFQEYKLQRYTECPSGWEPHESSI